MRSLLDIGAHSHVGRKYGNLARTEVMKRKVVALLAGLLVSGAVVSSPALGGRTVLSTGRAVVKEAVRRRR
jgi:hypothetical protein